MSVDVASVSSSPGSKRSRSGKGPGDIVRPTNEFSRVYHAQSILRGSPSIHGHQIHLEANEDERAALAERFGLKGIRHLEASLAMRQEPPSFVGSQGMGIEMEGTIKASVLQSCSRTDDDFDLNVEFPLYAVTRPVPKFPKTPEDEEAERKFVSRFGGETKRGKREKPRRSRRQKTSMQVPNRHVTESDLKALKAILEEVEVEDELFEDESVYTLDGKLDLGELVAQLFWLGLDP